MSVASHEMSYEPLREASPPAAGKRWSVSGSVRIAKRLPRIVLNLALLGVLGLVLMLMWAPGFIGANEPTPHEFRRPPSDRGFWFNRARDGRWGAPRPDRPGPN